MISVDITRRCRGAEYRFTVTNRGRSGASRVAVGGNLIGGTVVPYDADRFGC